MTDLSGEAREGDGQGGRKPRRALHLSLEIDDDGRITSSRPSTIAAFGRCPSDVVGQYASDLFVDDDALVARALFHRAGRDGTAGAIRLRMRDTPQAGTLTRVSVHRERGHARVRIRACESTELETFRADADERARFDPLTGLPNRLLLLEQVAQALRAEPSALVLIDVDGTQSRVTALGARINDRIMVEVADRLVESGPSGAIVGFFCGQFALCAPLALDTDAIDALIARIRTVVAAPLELAGDQIGLTMRAGAATSVVHGDSETLFADAAIALSLAKSLGRSATVVFDPGHRRRAERRIEIQTDLARAVVDNELRLDFQPIVDLEVEEIVGYEALVRWQHPTRGLLAPREFLGIAQSTGAGAAIDDWVLVEACRCAAEWASDGNPNTVCVNVTPERFASGGLVDRVEHALGVTGLDPGRLVIEITEWSVLDDLAAARNTLAALKGLSVRVALDDYGTGYSSLADLAALAVDEIKIDMTFVAGLGTDRARTAIVRAIIGLGHALDIAVVAEGVETAAQAFTLRALGCDFGQGFHFGRPASRPTVTARGA